MLMFCISRCGLCPLSGIGSSLSDVKDFWNWLFNISALLLVSAFRIPLPQGWSGLTFCFLCLDIWEQIFRIFCGSVIFLIWDSYIRKNIMFSMYLQYPCLCSFWISLFSFLSASLFGFCLGCLLRSLRLYLFIFFLNSSEIQGSLLSYLIVLVGIFFWNWHLQTIFEYIPYTVNILRLVYFVICCF